jgi:tagaturonate reductase
MSEVKNVPNSTSSCYLSVNHLSDEQRKGFDQMKQSPVKVLQIGEGNFLRGFFDWMLQQCRNQGLFQGSVAITQCRPSGKGNINSIIRQDGLYTLVIRGLENGEPVEKKEIVSVFSSAIDPYTDWDELLELMETPDLKFVVSNTTEAGLAYVHQPFTEGNPIESFPGKLTALLYHRFQSLKAAPDSGLIMLPCELLERNGDELKRNVIKHSEDWGLSASFIQWIDKHNRFLNSLVDRIVTGYPDDEAAKWFKAWGYQDVLLNTAEPYHLWVIEAEPELENEMPLRQAGLNVHWVDDLKPYQLRKVRILNGAHTLMAPLGVLYGVSSVREVMEDSSMGPFIRNSVLLEIIQTLPYPVDQMSAYADTAFERFLNPYIQHRLLDIAMNSVSKFRVRLLPSLAFYVERKLPLPAGLVRGLAGLIRFFRVRRVEQRFEGIDLNGRTYVVRDDFTVLERMEKLWSEFGRDGVTMEQTVERLLGTSEIWGLDLSGWDGLTEAISVHLRDWERRNDEQLDPACRE